MNTTEQIVESYFRICRECFTMADVKVIDGNNRQFDLLAYGVKQNEQYHVEIQVSASTPFALTIDQLFAAFETKFFGVPRKKDKKLRPRKKSYRPEIWKTYRSLGLDPTQLQRLWVCWRPRTDSESIDRLRAFNTKHEIEHMPLEVLSFQDDVIPELRKQVKTANYQDISSRRLPESPPTMRSSKCDCL